MANLKPLVIVSGKVQQLPVGATIDAPLSGYQQAQLQNANVGAIVIGAPVYISGAGAVDKAKADASGTSDPIGLVAATSISAAATGTIALDGVLTATTVQWDAVTGQSGGLTSGAVYYLDPSTAGKMTTTAPSTVGQYVVRLGKALSTVDFMIDIEEPILL